MLKERMAFKTKILILGIAAMFLLNTKILFWPFKFIPQSFKDNFRNTMAHFMAHFWSNLDKILVKYFGEDPMDGIAGTVLFLMLCYAQGYLLYKIFYNFRAKSKFSGYSVRNTKYKTTTRQGTMLVLEPVRDIYINSQKEAIRVLKLLRDYSRKTKMIALHREYSMTLLMDENKKLLLATIDNIGSYSQVDLQGHEIVYSYNTSFNGTCKKVIFAHTHPALPNIDGLYNCSSSLASTQDRTVHEQLKKLVYPVEVLDHIILPAIDSLPPYSLVTNNHLKDNARKIRPYPRWYFKTIYNGFAKDEPIMPTSVGVKLKYAHKSRKKGEEKIEEYEYKA